MHRHIFCLAHNGEAGHCFLSELSLALPRPSLCLCRSSHASTPFLPPFLHARSVQSLTSWVLSAAGVGSSQQPLRAAARCIARGRGAPRSGSAVLALQEPPSAQTMRAARPPDGDDGSAVAESGGAGAGGGGGGGVGGGGGLGRAWRTWGRSGAASSRLCTYVLPFLTRTRGPALARNLPAECVHLGEKRLTRPPFWRCAHLLGGASCDQLQAVRLLWRPPCPTHWGSAILHRRYPVACATRLPSAPHRHGTPRLRPCLVSRAPAPVSRFRQAVGRARTRSFSSSPRISRAMLANPFELSCVRAGFCWHLPPRDERGGPPGLPDVATLAAAAAPATHLP